MPNRNEAEAVLAEERLVKYSYPGRPGSIVDIQPRYENFVGSTWLAPTEGTYRVAVSPVDGSSIAEIARAVVLNAVADAIDGNDGRVDEMLAIALEQVDVSTEGVSAARMPVGVVFRP